MKYILTIDLANDEYLCIDVKESALLVDDVIC
jgi:hypothetical protein